MPAIVNWGLFLINSIIRGACFGTITGELSSELSSELSGELFRELRFETLSVSSFLAISAMTFPAAS